PDLWLPHDRQFRIKVNNDSVNQLTIRYYNQDMPIAKTPFAVDKIVPLKLDADSLYSLKLTDNESELLRLRYPGIYLFQTHPAQAKGLTLYCFDEDYPQVGNPLQALKPLRYLTMQKEYDELLKKEDLKTAVDSFWLERASNQPERTKNMISKFYLRVTEANTLFTSYKEGWKTDRGIIYIIYGPPTEVYRKPGEEEWIYGEHSNLLSIRFFFEHVENPLTTNDFVLERSTIYKTSWYVAVENWRR
ncbi:MAG: GWxTD domain-containing protein, partial [Bacteroidetes bacterium]|nr:GWxTD domain-containing protein [Bacteroidota bacterium]